MSERVPVFLYASDPIKIVLPPYSGLGVFGGFVTGRATSSPLFSSRVTLLSGRIPQAMPHMMSSFIADIDSTS